jgi:enoyl-[acyl-carrier protein] reductase I
MILKGKRIIITGVTDENSIAWSIAKSVKEQGGIPAFTYLGRAEKTAKPLIEKEMRGSCSVPMDATDDEQIKQAFDSIDKHFDGKGVDGLVHSIAFAKLKDLSNPFYKTEQKGFQIALTTSVYTLIALSRGVKPLMEKNGGGSIITMTYAGSVKVYPHYNIMGVAKAALESSVRYLAYDLGEANIRVNAVSAGALPTTAAQAIPGFEHLLTNAKNTSPLNRNLNHNEVGNTGAFLLSDMSGGITGEVIFTDTGEHIMGYS